MASNTQVNPKVTAATVAAAVSGLLVWVLGEYVFGGDVPEPVAVAVVTAATLAAGYFKREL